MAANARQYAAVIAAEVETLERVLGTSWELWDSCDECGEASGFCEGYYAPGSLVCDECESVEHVGEIGERCESSNCSGSLVANGQAHAFRVDDREAREMFEGMAAEARESVERYAPAFPDYCNWAGLEFSALGYNSGNGWEVTGAKLLRSFGGPNCWILWEDGSSSVLVSVYWGGDEYAQRVYAPEVAGGFDELAGAFDAA